MQLVPLIEECLAEMKAVDAVTLDVGELTSITDHMIICTGRSNRHIHSIADKLIETCKKNNVTPINASGLESDEWIIVDCIDVIVHILVQEARDFYQLEKIWSLKEKDAQEAKC